MRITRRTLLKAAASATVALPSVRSFAFIPDSPSPRLIAEAALKAARDGGASYADVRLVRRRSEYFSTRDEHLNGSGGQESFGLGVRVLKGGAWGFAGTPLVTLEGAKAAAGRALAIAAASAAVLKRPVQLAPEPAWQDSWQTPIVKDPFRVPVARKVALLTESAKAALAVNGVKTVRGYVDYGVEEKSFFSSEGAAIEQMIFRIDGGYSLTAVDEAKGDFESRSHRLPPRAAGWEHLEEGRLVEDAPALAREVVEKLKADSPKPGPHDLILDPGNLYLTIHETVGHTTELDRVLGYEANYAGTSFARVEDLGKLRFGPPMMHVWADKTIPQGLATCGYDDDGARTRRWDLIRDGVLVGFQTERDQLGLPGFEATGNTACSYADSWASVPFQRMPNISLAAGEKPLSLDQLIAGTREGILIQGSGSWSIDHQRRNFQFGGDHFWEIKDGKRNRPLRHVAYQGNTLEFWSRLDAICDASEWQLHGAMGDGKGEPGQANAVSHGCAPARFRQIRVLDVSRGGGES
jgi:TldD protein